MNPKIMKMKKQIGDEFRKIDIHEFLDLFQKEIQLPTIPGTTMGEKFFGILWQKTMDINCNKICLQDMRVY